MRWNDVFIAGLGTYLPAQSVTADEASAAGLYDAEQARVNGIRGVRVAAEHEAAPVMAAAAGRQALARSGHDPAEVSLVLHGSVGHQGRDFWTPAHYVQRETVGGTGAAMELRQGFNSALAATELAASWLTARPDATAALVTAGDVFQLPYVDRWRSDDQVVYGDGAGAMLLSSRAGFAKVRSTVCRSEPSLEPLYRGGDAWTSTPFAEGLPVDLAARKRAWLAEHASGADEVMQLIGKNFGLTLQQALDESDTDFAGVQWWVHATMPRPLVQWGFHARLGIDPARTPYEFGLDYGHMGSADQFVGLARLVETGQPGQGTSSLSWGPGSGSCGRPRSWRCWRRRRGDAAPTTEPPARTTRTGRARGSALRGTTARVGTTGRPVRPGPAPHLPGRPHVPIDCATPVCGCTRSPTTGRCRRPTDRPSGGGLQGEHASRIKAGPAVLTTHRNGRLRTKGSAVTVLRTAIDRFVGTAFISGGADRELMVLARAGHARDEVLTTRRGLPDRPFRPTARPQGLASGHPEARGCGADLRSGRVSERGRHTRMTTTRWLERPEGRIAFDVQGTGPLTVCVPGMGDLRGTFRHLVPPLVEAGHRVATMDLRGHGESDSSFASYDLEATVGDVRALVELLSGPAVLVGSSMGAGAAARLAADSPELVTGLVLSGPFLRESAPAWKRALLRIVMAPPWAAAAWRLFLPSLYVGRTPDDHEESSGGCRTAWAGPATPRRSPEPPGSRTPRRRRTWARSTPPPS